jgi:hypothetical protein
MSAASNARLCNFISNTDGSVKGELIKGSGQLVSVILYREIRAAISLDGGFHQQLLIHFVMFGLGICSAAAVASFIASVMNGDCHVVGIT